MLNGSFVPAGKPGERAAAKAEQAAQQPKSDIAAGGANGGHPTNGSAQSGEGGYQLRSGEENLVAMPDLNKVKLPHSTGVVEKATDSALQNVQSAKPVKSVEPEVARPLASEPDVPAARMEASESAVSDPEPEESKEEPVAKEDSFMDSAQIALRVIFGFEGELSRQEVLDLAKDLEGIREVKLVGGPEAAAMKVLRDSAEEFEFGGENGLILRSDGYPVEFVGDSKVCLCVILEQPELPKGTLEKLTLIAREAARLG